MKTNKNFEALNISNGEFALLDFGRIHTGFIKTKVKSKGSVKFLISFAEYVKDNFVDVNAKLSDVLNIVSYSLVAGEHDLETIECYGFRYAQITVLEGSLTVEALSIREYCFPEIKTDDILIDDPKLLEIYTAEVETFRQNTLDVYMDFPTRERAGWLCDSYYTSKSEYSFTGKTVVEKVYMENFVLGGDIPHLPKGMIAMAYPGDFFNGNFIPQWSMWYVLELNEYLKRNANADKAFFKKLCYGLVDFFRQYHNEYDLLEKLPGWNFVEWSKANNWVWDVNFPTNMLYARFLEIIV